MASLELPTDLDGLIRLHLELQAEIASITAGLAIADPFGAEFLAVDLDRALQRLAVVDFAILALAPPEPIPDIPPDPRFAIPDHLAADFTDLEILNDHLASHATVITQLGSLLPQPDPIQDEGIRAQIFAIVVHFPSHNAARLALEVPPEEEVDGGILAPVFDFLGSMWSGITGDVLAGQTSSRDFLGNLINPMSGLTSGVWDLLDDPASVLYARIDQAFGDRLPDDLGEVGAGIAGIRDQLIDIATEGIPGAISGAQEGIASFIGAGFDAFFEGSGKLIGTVLGGAATAFLEALEKNFPAFGGLLFGSLLDFDELPEEIRPLIKEALEPTSQVGALFANAATQTAVQGTVGNFLGALLAPLTFAIQRTLIPTHMDVGAAIRAGFRFSGLKETIDREIRDLGFSEGRQELLERTLRPAPSIGDLRALVNRGAITEPDALRELQEQGLLLSDANMLLSLRRVLPGPSDIVRFAVREAFDPAIVARFGLDADFPETAVALAERVGLSREDFLFNWRAHWELPSATQAFEMLHRDVIGPEDLDLLLRTQDVMPFWRDKIVAIAFTPFTRVDIRRFFRTNVFGPRDSPGAIAQVIRAYKDIGYDDEKAAIQAQFVEAEDLDRSFDRQLPEIRQQAKLGTLSLAEALDEIAEIAPDPSTAEETVGLLERDVRGEHLGELLRANRQALRSRRISEDGFRAAVAKIGIDPDLVQHFINVEDIRRGEESAAREEVALRASGRGSVVRRFREGLTDEADFRDEMAVLGYTDEETARYLDIARLDFDTNWRLDLLQAALTAFRKARITLDQLSDRLDELGIQEVLRDAYLDREIARIRVEDPDADEVELRATGRGVILRRYREGWTDADAFGAEMASLGYTDPETVQYLRVADLEFDYDWRQDALANLREGFRKDVIDAGRFISDLVELGMDPQRAQTHLARETLKKGVNPEEAPAPAA